MFLNLLIRDMAKTRGAFVRRGGSSSSHAEAFEQEPRQRPTASVRRRGKGILHYKCILYYKLALLL